MALLAPLTHRVPPTGYGPWEQVVADLADALTGLGHELAVFATSDAEVKADVEWVVPRPFEDWPADEILDRRIWEELHIAALAAETAKGRFDLIHNHLSVHPLGYAALLPVPVLTTLHGVAWNPGTHPALDRYRHLPFVSLSDAERRLFPDLHYVATVHNGVDVGRYPYGPGGGGYLLFAGRLAPEKAPHLAIAAAAKTGFPVKLAGPVEDKHRSYFDSMVAPSIDGRHADYLGPVTRKELVTLYGEAEALVLPLEWDEPFGLVTVEAMITGTPVVGWRRGALPELISEGTTGFLVDDVGDAVRALGRLDELDRRECRAHAADRFSAQRMASEYAGVYERILSGSPSARVEG